MHLIVPFAGVASDAGRQAMGTLALPQLERLLARLASTQAFGSDEFSLSAPHELAVAAERGWPLDDGRLPWAADAAARAGIDPGDRGWALLTPVHLRVEADCVVMADPGALELGEDESRELLDAVRPLFEGDGFGLHWLAADRWLASHELFAVLTNASIDRVRGRDIDPWLPAQPEARPLRRLQNEVQMLLHAHPANQRREAAGQLLVNSFWCHGCGRAPAPAARDTAQARVDDRLREPAMAQDWAAWAEAWAALDAGPIAKLLASGDEVQITLCGERRAVRHAAASRGLWQRLSSTWQRKSAAQWLETL